MLESGGFLANINSNGLLDIVGCGDQHVFVAYNNGDGTFLLVKPILANFCYDNGWHIPKHPQFVVDMSGDSKLNLVGFAGNGVFVMFNNVECFKVPTKFQMSFVETWEVGPLVMYKGLKTLRGTQVRVRRVRVEVRIL